MGEQQFGIDPAITTQIAKRHSRDPGARVQTAIVIGGGNLFPRPRGKRQGMDRATAATLACWRPVINALAVQDALEHHGIPTRVASAIEMRAVAEPFIRRRAVRHLEKGRVRGFRRGTVIPTSRPTPPRRCEPWR